MRLLAFILVLFFATLLGVIIRQDPGYALFAYQDWTVEMPLWLAAVILFGVIFLSFMILAFFYFLFSSASRVKYWWSHRQTNRARSQLIMGLLELTEGRYKKAEQFLSNSAKFSDVPLIHYLSAAKAAEANNAPERRDKYLQLAHNVSGKSDVAVRLTEAELSYSHGDLEQSVATLQHLHAEQPKHPLVLKLLCKIYESMQDWHSLYTLLPELKKEHIFPNDETFLQLELNIYHAMIPSFATKDTKALFKFWRSAPKSVQQDPVSIAIYVECLIKHDENSAAEETLKQALKQKWDPQLIELYGKVRGSSLHKQLNFAESCLSAHSRDPYLYLTLGKLCIAQSLWGKARDYLEVSVNIKPMPESYALLGKVMEQMGNMEKAQEYYKKGLLTLNA